MSNIRKQRGGDQSKYPLEYRVENNKYEHNNLRNKSNKKIFHNENS